MYSVVFLDSGIGGIPYLLHALAHIPDMYGLYVADTGFFPYGTRKPAQLKAHLHRLMADIQAKYAPTVCVLACNTASVTALESLRGSLQQAFVGTVPAVKPAAELSRNGKIGIMATEHTVQDPYLSALLSDHAAGQNITMLPAGGLIRSIEERFFDPDYPELARIADYFLNAGTDTVVLGCTHFVHVEKHLQKLWNNSINLIDSREGISHQIYRHLRGLPTETKPELHRQELGQAEIAARSSFFITSPERTAYYEAIAAHFGLTFGGTFDPGGAGAGAGAGAGDKVK